MVGIAAFAAIIAALLTAVPVFVLGLMGEEPDDGTKFGHSGGAAVLTLIVTFLIDWGIFHWAPPIFSGANWAFLVVTNLVIAAIFFGLIDGWGARFSAAPFVAGACAVIIGLGGPLWSIWWPGQSNVDKILAEIPSVEIIEPKDGEDPATAYPNTDEQKMVVIGDQAARHRADRVLGTDGIGTRYNLGDSALQDIDGHMFYVFPLEATGWTDSNKVKYTVPGYVKVDAEDPNASPEAITSIEGEDGEMEEIKIKYWETGGFEHKVTRYVYYNGYKTGYLDGVSLEIDNNGRPYYTMTFNKPAHRWHQATPTAFLTLDAQTGEIKEYRLDKVPEWVDLVYSQDTAEYLLNAWGRWHKSDYKPFFQGNDNRFKVSGHLNLVYTDDGPAWQALLTSYKSDKAVQYIALMDTQTGHVRVYDAPSGLLTEESIENSFSKSDNNLKRNDPTNLALYKVYGELTWVASMVGDGEGCSVNDDDDEESCPATASFAGIGVVNATSSDSNNVIIGDDKNDVFTQYSAWIANGSNNNDPEENANVETIEATVAAVSDLYVFNETSYITITLEGDPDHLYKGQVADDISGQLMTVTQPGDQVIITYVNTGDDNPVRNITSLSNMAYVGVTD